MSRLRRLSMQEWIWVREAISQLCSCHSVSDQDEDYRSVAWTAFFIAFRRFHPISSPNFWPYAYRKINAALVREKWERQDRVYCFPSAPARPSGASGR